MTKLILKSYIRPTFDYGSSVWNSGYIEDSKLIESVQRKFTKLCFELKGLDYSNRLSILNIPTLKFRKKRGDLINIFKLINNENTFFNECFELNDRTSRGHNLKINVPRVLTECGKRSFYFRTITSWNNLSFNTVNAKSVNEFKNLLDKELFCEMFLFY